MKKKIILFLVGLFLLTPSANAVSYHTYGVTQKEQQLIEKEQNSKNNFLDDLEYRFIEKDTYDSVDYVILGVIISLMLVIIVFLNKKTYVIFSEQSVFEKESVNE